MTLNHELSVIIPVLNEAATINSTIEALKRLSFGGKLEIIVSDGNSEGTTITAITHKDVLSVMGKKGRGVQMNQGASVASGDILLFLHSDTLLPPDALNRIVQAFAADDVVGGAFDLGIQSEKRAFRLIENVASMRSRVTRIPYGDQAIFIKNDFFRDIGGYKAMPLMEDVDLMQRIKKAGHRIRFIPSKVRTSPRRWEKEGILYCTLRNWLLITLWFLGVYSEKLAGCYPVAKHMT